MALKTFNIDAALYQEFSAHCKKHGISMSKKVERFIAEELEKMRVLTQHGTSLRDFALDVEKGVQAKQPKLAVPGASKATDRNVHEHPMGKYC